MALGHSSRSPLTRYHRRLSGAAIRRPIADGMFLCLLWVAYGFFQSYFFSFGWGFRGLLKRILGSRFGVLFRLPGFCRFRFICLKILYIIIYTCSYYQHKVSNISVSRLNNNVFESNGQCLSLFANCFLGHRMQSKLKEPLTKTPRSKSLHFEMTPSNQSYQSSIWSYADYES